MRSSQYRLWADHHQFYIQDELADDRDENAWDNQAVERTLAMAQGVVRIMTFQNWHVPVTLEVHDGEPEDGYCGWDHVVECDLAIASGRIVIAGCTGYFPDADRVEVMSGTYVVRVSYAAPTKLSDDGLNVENRYRVQLWPRPLIAPRVIVQRGYSLHRDPVSDHFHESEQLLPATKPLAS